MEEDFLRELYRKFLKLDRNYFFLDLKNYFLTKIKIPDRVLEEFYQNYEKETFLSFLLKIKSIIYSKNVFEFTVKEARENWDLWPYLELLEKEGVIKVKRNGKILILKKEILKFIPPPLNEKQIKTKVEKALGKKIKEKEPMDKLVKSFKSFIVKTKWDQSPISQGSALFVVRKILENLPLNKKFLFIGDDDFISLILSLANPEIESLVIDIDDQVLSLIKFLAKKFKLKIETRKVDIRKEKNLGEKFIGFLTNPPYTEGGVEKFVNYGVKHLGKDGGVVFLEVGDDAIGNRFLFLQDFFTRKNLIIKEVIAGKIFYPYYQLYKEDKVIFRRLSSKIDEKIIKTSPMLGAALWIFEFLPFKPKRVKFKTPIYLYL